MAEFTSNAQALFWIFIYGFWILLLYMTYYMKGERGKTVGFFNILQMLFAIVIGVNFAKHSFLIGFGSMMVGVGTFIGKLLYER